RMIVTGGSTKAGPCCEYQDSVWPVAWPCRGARWASADGPGGETMGTTHGAALERRATVLETPYRAFSPTPQALPVETATTLLRYDLGTVRAKPFLPTETESAVVEAVPGGVRVRGRRDGWSYAH